MAPDSSQPTPLSSSPAPQALPLRARDKVRIRFRKGGPLRFLSHHDLLRTFERMLRRAALPFHHTQGFNPHPRLIFALSLPLGVVGQAEVVELELTEVLDLQEIRQRLSAQTPHGLDILSLVRIDPKAGAQVRTLCYGLAIPAGRVGPLQDRIAEVLSAPQCWIERPRSRTSPRAAAPTGAAGGEHPNRSAGGRRLDLRPLLRDLRLRPLASSVVHCPLSVAKTLDDPATDHGPRTTDEEDWFLEIHLWLTASGTARPDEVLTLLGLHDLLENGCVLERTWLELEDENS
jgi:radical SAM-linked protein